MTTRDAGMRERAEARVRSLKLAGCMCVVSTTGDGYVCPACASVTGALLAAHRAGAEAMREKAIAEVIDFMATPWSNSLADRIRALPLEDEHGE